MIPYLLFFFFFTSSLLAKEVEEEVKGDTFSTHFSDIGFDLL